MTLKYVSKNGSVEMSGGGKADIRITDISGLENPTPSFKTVEFAEENGVTQIAKKDMARVITLAGDVRGDNIFLRHISRVFHENGELFCFFHGVNRKIYCKCTAMPEFVRKGGGFYSFALQLQADYPYFNDLYDTKIPIFIRRNRVSNTFTLPMVFTERITDLNVNIYGDKAVYPIIVIANNEEPTTSLMGEDENRIIMKNERTNATITLNYVPSAGETVTVDLKKRRITSSTGENLTNSISDDTVLSDFYFDVGSNRIAVKSGSNYNTLSGYAIYNNEYFSAEV